MALAEGKSSIRAGPITLHTQTAIEFTHQLLGGKVTLVIIFNSKDLLILIVNLLD